MSVIKVKNETGEFVDIQVLQGKQGIRGEPGVSITTAVSGSISQSGQYTITPIMFNKSDGSSSTVNVNAKNGTDGAGVIAGGTTGQVLTKASNTDRDTKWVTPISLLDVYPVGSIYMSVNNVNPSTLFGGTWQLWGSGRVPVCVDTSQTEFNTVEKTGGEKTHKLTVQELASHPHGFQGGSALFTQKDQGVKGLGGGGYWVEGVGSIPNTSNAGGDHPHNNLQPYITCYMWKRTR